jgi:hypothetical protein
MSQVHMYVAPCYLSPTASSATLPEDRSRPTPALTVVTVIDSIVLTSTYNNISDTAILFITKQEYLNLAAILSECEARIDITYTDTPDSSPKVVTYHAFNKAEPASIGASSAGLVYAIEQRLESGVSHEIRNDIRMIKAEVSDIKAAVQTLLSRDSTRPPPSGTGLVSAKL